MTDWEVLVQEATGDVEDALLALIDEVGLAEALARMGDRLPLGERFRRPPMLPEAILCVIAYEKVHAAAPQLADGAVRSPLVELVKQLSLSPQTPFLTPGEREAACRLAQDVEAAVEVNVFDVALQLLVSRRPDLLAAEPSDEVVGLFGRLAEEVVPQDQVILLAESLHDSFLRDLGGSDHILLGERMSQRKVFPSTPLAAGEYQVVDPSNLL